MQTIKISSKVDEVIWKDLKTLAKEQHRNISDLLTEAIREYIARKRVRVEIRSHLETSIEQNDELLELLSK